MRCAPTEAGLIENRGASLDGKIDTAKAAAFTACLCCKTPFTSSDGSGVMRMLATETTMTMARPTLASRNMLAAFLAPPEEAVNLLCWTSLLDFGELFLVHIRLRILQAFAQASRIPVRMPVESSKQF